MMNLDIQLPRSQATRIISATFVTVYPLCETDWRGKANETLKKRYRKSKRSLFKVVFC